MFQMQSSGGVTFIEKMPFKISPNYNYIKKTLWYNCFPGNFEWKVRARASDVFNTNISISFLVYKNLKPNKLTDIKADFYICFFFNLEFLLSFGKNIHTLAKVLQLCYEWNISKYCKYSHHIVFWKRRKTKWENIKYLWLKIIYKEKRFFCEVKKWRRPN